MNVQQTGAGEVRSLPAAPVGAARPVFLTVLPTLLLWFVLLSAADRFRLLDRALRLDP